MPASPGQDDQPPSTGKELPCPPREGQEPTAVTPPYPSPRTSGRPQPETAARQRSGDICLMRAPTVLVTALVYRFPQLVSAPAHTSPTKVCEILQPRHR
jgi:hypothetical protein